MTSRGGRFRRDFQSSRSEETSKRGSNAPSRHLWVGNLSHTIIEDELLSQFARFGELDTVAFQPGRSYAFVNYKSERDAIDAMDSLQGFPLAGNPLRIEFAKADKSSTPRNEDYLQRHDEQRSSLRGSPYLQRDSRVNVSPDSVYPERSKVGDKNAEPSEVLWIGFPALLKVDEMILRKAFSPFGEIEKITVFPGRSYAFVRFRNLLSACRAKDTLQGKLFGNPRVHICFAKNEGGSSSSGRTTLSPRVKSNGRSGAFENFRQERNFDSLEIKSPHLVSNLDHGDADVYGFKRKGSLYPGESNTFDNWRFGEELGPPPDVYERQGSPIRERGAHFNEYSEKLTQKVPFYEEPWDLPEDPYLFHGAKKLKTGPFPPERELPEYPFVDPEQEKRVRPRAFSDFGQPEPFDKNFESGPLSYRPVTDHQNSLYHPHGERSDRWRASHDIFPSGSGSLPPHAMERKRPTPEPERPTLKLWKWEGTIAKGGTPVCRARCFPVGKSMDMLLPEFLDCTARTGLDMLAKHYYQAASAWVVFFVPADDADIGYYNEFMHYLREKQRAAVAKLDEKTTLFLVPPSDFSKKVLKVPGDMSISGVVLRLEHPGSNFGPPHHPNENTSTNSVPFHGDVSYPRPSTPSGHLSSMASFPDAAKSGRDPPFWGNVTSFSDNENRHDYASQQRNSMSEHNWSPPRPPNIGRRNIQSQISSSIDLAQDPRSIMPRAAQENSPNHYAGGLPSNPQPHPETKPSIPLSMPITGLQPQQLMQLASSLLGQQKQSGSVLNVSMGEDLRQTSSIVQSKDQFRTAQKHGLQNNMLSSEISASQLGQLQQLLQQQQQTTNVPISMPPVVRREPQPAAPGNAQMQSSGIPEEGDGDPQKRLQATLQLAAALLQQLQQGKET